MEYSDEVIWGVVEVGGVGSVMEGWREAAGEQSADDVCDWVAGAQGVDCGNDKKLAIIVCWQNAVMKNQNTLSNSAIMGDIVIIGDYELLEKQNEGYETNWGNDA